MKRKLPLILAALVAALPLSACGTAETPDEGSSSTIGDEPSSAVVESDVDFEECCDGVSLFTNELFRSIALDEQYKGQNTLLSPLSVYTALGMVTCGAHGTTKDELCAVLSGEIDRPDSDIKFETDKTLSPDEIASALNDYMSGVNSGDVMKIANSIFIMERDDIDVSDAFIKTGRKQFLAEIFNEKYSEKTVDNINAWVKKNTKEMIPTLLNPDDINDSTVSVLLNAIAFDGKWVDPYDPESDVLPLDFNNYDGTVTNTDFMYSLENGYFESDNATGFVKAYQPDENVSYCFVAMLPNKDVTIDEFISDLTPSTVTDFVESAGGEVITYTPKFSFDDKYRLAEVISKMGIHDAFDRGNADFSLMANSKEGNCIYIGDIVHKTHIELDEQGTKAAAATAIIMQDNAVAAEEEPPKEVILDRPFVFAIYDRTNNLPVFIGTVCCF